MEKRNPAEPGTGTTCLSDFLTYKTHLFYYQLNEVAVRYSDNSVVSADADRSHEAFDRGCRAKFQEAPQRGSCFPWNVSRPL